VNGFRCLSYLFIAILLFSSTGCSVFVGGTQQLTVVATEDNADIYINGQIQGKGTTTVMVPRNRGVEVMVKAPGFKTETKTVGYTLSGTGLADLAGAFICIVPGIGLLTPGAQELTMDTVTIPMEPLNSPANSEKSKEGE